MALLQHKAMWAKRARAVAFWLVAMVLTVLIGMVLAARPAHAATFTVNSTGDAVDQVPGNGTCFTGTYIQIGSDLQQQCTLRAAIQETNANGQSDTINFHSALSGTITLSGKQLQIANDTPFDDDLTIQGPGASKLTVSGNDASRVFQVDESAAVTISGLTISHGKVVNDLAGGGIRNFGRLTLTSSTVSDNTVQVDGGSTVAWGGGIYNNDLLRLTNSTVSANTALVGGGITSLGTMILTNSTVSANTAQDYGGGIHNSGTLSLTNSTVSANTAQNYSGGGINIPSGTVSLRNTIIARNSARISPDIQGRVVSNGYNLIGNTNGAEASFLASDIKNVNPLLGPLQNNGGPTETHALLGGSPAVDAGNPATPGTDSNACEATDQRGKTRPQNGNGDATAVCDIGSFERQDTVAPTVKSVSPTGKKVSPRANVTATFSEVMDEVSVEAPGTFTLKKKGTTTTIPATVIYDPSTRKATLDPTRKLRSGATYIAKVTAAAKDSAGNALDQNSTTAGNQPKSWRFTVK